MTELDGVLDVDKRPIADDSEERKVGVFAVKNLILCFHLERRMRDPIARVGCRHHELSPQNRRKFAVNEHEANHSAQRPPGALGCTDLLWRVGCSKSYDCS